MKSNPYLHYQGNCEEAFKFYEKSLDGKVMDKMTYAGTPMENHVPPEWKNKMIHSSMKIGDTVLMGSDCSPEHYERPQGFFVALNVEKPEEAEKIFKALSEKGEVKMPIQETFWALRFGMLVDQFGIPWSVDCAKEQYNDAT